MATDRLQPTVTPGSLLDMLRANPRIQSPASHRDDLVTILMGTWLMIGLFVDGWAHNNLPGLETFFTPWHGIFYSGFLATAVWMSWLVLRNLRAGKAGAAAVPFGYGMGLLGLILFGLGGFGDMLWHIIFGIEKDIEALLSPTHLLIFIGGVLVISTPARAAWARKEQTAPRFGQFLPALISVTMTAAFVIFMNQYAWGLNRNIPFATMAGYYQSLPVQVRAAMVEAHTSMTATQILLSTAMVMAPLLLMVRRWRLPAGSIFFFVSVITLLMTGMRAFQDLHTRLFAPVAAALLIEALLAALRPAPNRLFAFRAFALVAPLLFWSCYFTAGQLVWGMYWTPELWAGITVMAGLVGLGLSVLVVPEAQ
ncbi:MAG TPA: hypothetical protein VNT75_18755 [Symbiobacteriaceae bacterium]|nr:hypothetical protein [Symbiobacteriaceae bacterium]